MKNNNMDNEYVNVYPIGIGTTTDPEFELDILPDIAKDHNIEKPIRVIAGDLFDTDPGILMDRLIEDEENALVLIYDENGTLFIANPERNNCIIDALRPYENSMEKTSLEILIEYAHESKRSQG